MTEPTRQDALDAADVFFTSLNVLLYHGEMEHVDSSVVAQHAASLRSSMICSSMAEQMDVDMEGLERVCLYMAKKQLGEDSDGELVERLIRELKDSEGMRN